MPSVSVVAPSVPVRLPFSTNFFAVRVIVTQVRPRDFSPEKISKGFAVGKEVLREEIDIKVRGV